MILRLLASRLFSKSHGSLGLCRKLKRVRTLAQIIFVEFFNLICLIVAGASQISVCPLKCPILPCTWVWGL